MILEQRPHILAVDHDPITRQLVKLHLERAGYDVSLAASATIAGCRLVHSTPHLLMVAAEMPEVSGLEFVSSLIADCALPCTPVVFLSESGEFRARAKALGAAMLLKPLSPQRLVELVRGLVPTVRYAGTHETLHPAARAAGFPGALR